VYNPKEAEVALTRFLEDDGRNSADWGTPAWEERYQGYLKGPIAPYIEDASFLKLRELSVGVDVPASVVGALNLGLETMRVSLTGRNLFMWTKYTGLDPEVANFGSAAIRGNLDIAPFPPSRSVFFNPAIGF